DSPVQWFTDCATGSPDPKSAEPGCTISILVAGLDGIGGSGSGSRTVAGSDTSVWCQRLDFDAVFAHRSGLFHGSPVRRPGGLGCRVLFCHINQLVFAPAAT